MKTRFFMIVCLVAASSCLLAAGFSLSGVGARAISMGGAMRGLGDDFSTVYWNPAGLAFLNGDHAALALATITPSGDYTPTTGLPGITDGNTYDAEQKTWAFPNLYYTHQAPGAFDWGMGIYVPYGLGATWDIWSPPETMPVDLDGDGVPETMAPITWADGIIQDEFESSIGIVDIHPTASYQIGENMSVGVGLSVMYGMINITKIMPHYNPANPAASYYTYLPSVLDMEGDGMGVGANFGFMWRAMENLRVGVSGKIPGSLKLKGDATLHTYLNSITGPALTPATGPVNLKSDLDAEATVNLPADAGLGFAWWPMPQWVVTASTTWTGWSRLDYIEVEFDGNDTFGNVMSDSKLNTRWDDSMRYSLGTEYKFHQLGALDVLALRGGFYYDETPIPDETQDPLWPDVGDKSSFNFGIGLGLDRWALDMGYEYMSFDTRELDQTIWNAEGSIESMAGEYNTTVNAFNAAVSYSF